MVRSIIKNLQNTKIYNCKVKKVLKSPALVIKRVIKVKMLTNLHKKSL